jgi:UDP-N-acetylmuramoyl-L-alanyl-D-glutamate--2,6-diaminopimelate ligase
MEYQLVKLTQLLDPWINQKPVDCTITGISNDSREVQTGDLFIAYPGAVVDGRLYIELAVSAGAVAVAYDPLHFPASCPLPDTIPCIAIPKLSEQLALISSRFYDNPSDYLSLTGVTGTNGKTTIAYQLAQAHHLLGQASAYIGTIGQGDVDHLRDLNNTTPDALCLQKLLHEYKTEKIQKVCMEVSSHALSQHRVDNIKFKQAIFTNLTLDHLDYHQTMEAYGAAKARLFESEHLEWVIINIDDAHHTIICNGLKPQVKKLTYGLHLACDVRAVNWDIDINGTNIEVHSPWGDHLLKMKAIGQFNIYNGLAIFSSLLASGYNPVDVIRVMAELKAAPGRMDVVANSPYVLIDYAHTPDALENALMTLSELKKGKLWVVFGCGGDRDKTKRPIMGKAASHYADNVIITSDNPRSEDPQIIIEEIEAGIVNSMPVTKIVNREEAINYALSKADKDDIILIAGKGHEAYQQIGSVKHQFSDHEIVRKLIKNSKVEQ